MECLKCGHKSEALSIRCTACGAIFPRPEFEELSRIRSLLEEASRWARRGIISTETLDAIQKFYQTDQARLERALGLQHAAAPAPFPLTPTSATRSGALPVPVEQGPIHSAPTRGPSELIPAPPRGHPPVRDRRQPRTIGVPAAAHLITWKRLWTSLFAEHALDLMLYLGALLFVVSSGVLVIRYWTQLPPAVRTLIVLLGTGLFYAGGFFVRARLRAQHSGIVISGIGALLVPLNTVTIARTFGVESAHWPLLWLLSFLVMVPLNTLTARWLQAEFFVYIALASVVGGIGSALSLAGLPFPWWGAPIVLAGVVFLLLAPRAASSFLAILQRPMVVGGALLGLLAGPWVLWVAGGIYPYLHGGDTLARAAPVAAAWAAAAVLGAVLVAQRPTQGHAYGTATALAGASLLAAAAVAPVAWVSLGLVIVAAAGALLEGKLTRWEEMVGRPCRHVAWACAVIGGVWSFMSLSASALALALDAAGALWWARFYHRRWLLLLGLALIAGSLTAAMLRANVPLAALGAGWIGLGLVYIGVAQSARMSTEGAAALYLAGYGLLLCAQGPALLWPSEAFQVLALGVALGVSAWSIYLGDHDRAVRVLLGGLPRPWPSTLFTWIAAALLPLWALRVWLWQGGTVIGAGVMLCTVAFLYSPVAYRLGFTASPRALPLLSVAYLLGIVGPLLTLPDHVMLTLALVLDTVFLAALAMGFGSRRLAGFATVASLGAILAAPLRAPILSSPAILTAVGFLYSIAQRQAGRVRGTGVFAVPLFWASRVAAALAFVVASAHLTDGRTLSGLTGYVSLALLLVVWSLMDQEQHSAALGAMIGAAAVTIATDTGLLVRLGLHIGDHGPAWAALALVLGSIGICLGRWRRGAGGLLPFVGTGLAVVALLAAVDRSSSEWVTLSFALALFGLCATFQLLGRLPVLEGWLRRVEWSRTTAGIIRAGYVYLFVWLLPFWVYLTMARIPTLAATRENLGVGLVLLAWAYLGISRLVTAIQPAYDTPWLTTAPPLAAAGLLIAVTERLPFVVASAAALMLCVGFALTLRTPRWFYPAALLAAPAWVLGLAQAGLSTQLLGPGLLALAVGELALGEWLTRRAGSEPDSIPAAALPFWIVGFVLIPLALLWGSVSGATIALSMFLAGAAVYWVSGLRFNDALFSYPVTGLLGLSYIAGTPLVQNRLLLPTISWAVWFLPGVIASMLTAGILSRTHPPLRARPFFSRSPAAAPVALASGGAAAVIALGWSEPWLRVGVTAAAAAVYLLGLRVAYAPRWFYPALLAGHLAYGFAVVDAGLVPDTPLAIWFVPVMLAMTAGGVLMSRGRDRGEGRRLVDRLRSASWGGPFYVFAAAGLLVWMIAALSNTQALAVMLAAGTVMVGTIAAWWRDTRFGSLSAILGAATVLAVFAWKQVAAAVAEPWIAVIALAFGILWGGAVIVARHRSYPRAMFEPARFWAGPLRLEAVILGALALGGSIVGALAGLPGSDRAFVLCLALVGFLVLEIATLEEHEVLSYVAVLMLGVAWGLWLYYDRGVREVQSYAVPGALYLLWVGLTQDRRGRRRLAGILDSAGLTLLLASSLLQSVIKAYSPLTLAYGGLVAAESLCILWWGIARRRRRFAVAGCGALVLDVVAQIIQPLLLMSRWVITGVVGLVLVLGALVVERKRETIARISQQVRAEMEEWRW